MAAPAPDELFSKVWAPDIFKGKVVFCTGGAGSICSGQVRALVKLGANAAILGRRAEHTAAVAAEIATLRPGAKVIGLAVDVRSYDSVASAVATTVKELGRIDFVISGAAGNFLSTFENLSANAFKTVVDIDLIGSFNTAKATLQELKKSKGKLLFISASFHYTGAALQSHVCAAKAGVDALSHALSIELGPHGITSNVITPGGVANTEGIERLMDPANREASNRKIPLQRLAVISEISDATIYLFSDAGRYVNGVALVVDGGAWRNGTGLSGSLYPGIVLDGGSKQGAYGKVNTGRGGQRTVDVGKSKI